MKNGIQVGDVVKLKSGSPAMTVAEVFPGDMVDVIWADQHGETRHTTCPRAVLEIAPKR